MGFSPGRWTLGQNKGVISYPWGLLRREVMQEANVGWEDPKELPLSVSASWVVILSRWLLFDAKCHLWTWRFRILLLSIKLTNLARSHWWNSFALDFLVINQLYQVTSTCGFYGVSSVHHTPVIFFLGLPMTHLAPSAEKVSPYFLSGVLTRALIASSSKDIKNKWEKSLWGRLAGGHH